MEITFDARNLATVPLASVRPNTWNPKQPDTAEAARVLASVKENGQRLPIVVRENLVTKDDGTDSLYEIIDGEQRYWACVKLEFAEILVYNEGQVSDSRARALTIWYQQQVPFDRLLEAALVTSLADVTLPYTDGQRDEFLHLVAFDWTSVQPSAESSDFEEVAFRTLTLRFEKDAYLVVMGAIETVHREQGVSTERAVELICADFAASGHGVE